LGRALAVDETQKSRLADPPLVGRRDDADAFVTTRFSGDLLPRPDEHFAAVGTASFARERGIRLASAFALQAAMRA
jgi:hypothetical protein